MVWFPLALVLVPSAQPKDAPAPPALVLTGVTLIDGTGTAPQPGTTVVVVGDRITAVGRAGVVAVPAGATVVAADGKFLIPGLWDMHVHLEEGFLPMFVGHGVTGVRHMFSRPTFRTLPVREWQREAAAGRLAGPRIVACTKSIDGINGDGTVIPGTAIQARTPEEGRGAVQWLRKNGEEFVKVYPFLKPDVYFAVLDEAGKGPNPLPVTGHVPHLVSAADACERGQRCMEHSYGVLLCCAKDEEKLRKELAATIESGAMVKDTLDAAGAWRIQVKALDSYDPAKAEAFFKKLVTTGTWQVPTLATRRSWALATDPTFTADPRVKFLPVHVRLAWKSQVADGGVKFPIIGVEMSAKDVEHQKMLLDGYLKLVGAMNKAGVKILAGTDTPVPLCFPGAGLHDELELLVKAGLTPAEALRTATRNPAEYLGRLKDLGTVERGKLADLVLLDADPLADIRNTRKIHAVVAGGRLYPREVVARMAEGQKP